MGMFVGLTAPHKKAPLDSSCPDAFRVWQIEGARSRNHKKLRCSACAVRFRSSQQGHTSGTSSGPTANIGGGKLGQQVPSGSGDAKTGLTIGEDLV